MDGKRGISPKTCLTTPRQCKADVGAAYDRGFMLHDQADKTVTK